MNNWEKFNQASLPEKEDFYDFITDTDYGHAKRVCKEFEIS